MPEKEVSVKAKLIDNISEPSEKVIERIDKLGEVTERNLLHLREELVEYYEGNEQKAEAHYRIILEELEVYHRTQETVIGDNLRGLIELYDDFYEKKLRKQMAAGDEGIAKTKEVGESYADLAQEARLAKIAIDELGASIAALESKTITITTIQKTEYVTEGSPENIREFVYEDVLPLIREAEERGIG